MTLRFFRTFIALYLASWLAAGVPAFAQQDQQAQQQGQQQQSSQAPAQTAPAPAIPYPRLLNGPNYSKNKRTFPNFWSAYSPRYVPPPNLTSAPDIFSLIQDGKLELSLQNAIALALQNDLDIAVAQYIPWINQAQLLNAEGGGTPTGAILGGGIFDPVITSTASISDNFIPVNNALQSGVGVGTAGSFFTLKTHLTQLNVDYSQELHTGTVFSVGLNNNRSSSTTSQNFFNPAVASNLTLNLSQPLLRGFGTLPNTHFILEAKNTTQIGGLQFEEQVITSVTQVETQYWTLVADLQAVDVAQQTLTVSQKLEQDDERQLQIGTLAHLDVVTAQSAIATNNQALIAAQTNALQQATVVLNLITKEPTDPRLQNVQIVPTTPLEQAPEVSAIELPDAIKEAWADRPELKVDQFTLSNDKLEVRATRNTLLPSLTLSGTYESQGLGGQRISPTFTPNGTFTQDLTQPIVDQNGNPVLVNGAPAFVGSPNGTFGQSVTPGGIGTTYSDIFHNNFPTYAASLTLALPLRNRSAQAANAQAQLTEREQQTIIQRDKNAIVVGVRQAITAVQQDQAQVQATEKATQLAQETYNDEVKKFDLGASTTYNVVLQSRDLNAAKLNELQAKANLAIALVNFNQALGRTLTSNSITIADARHGLIDFERSVPEIPGTIAGRLAGEDVFGLGMGK